MVSPLYVSDHDFIRGSVRLLEHPTIPPPVASSNLNRGSLSSNEFSLVASYLPTLFILIGRLMMLRTLFALHLAPVWIIYVLYLQDLHRP